MNIVEIRKKAIPEIIELLGKTPESISAIEKIENGWKLHCDILEKKSIPETFDLLKIFEFKLDKEGKITEYKQLKKIRRGDID